SRRRGGRPRAASAICPGAGRTSSLPLGGGARRSPRWGRGAGRARCCQGRCGARWVPLPGPGSRRRAVAARQDLPGARQTGGVAEQGPGAGADGILGPRGRYHAGAPGPDGRLRGRHAPAGSLSYCAYSRSQPARRSSRPSPKHPLSAYTHAMRASDRAYTTLREEIIDGSLAPGAVLGEVEQSQRLGLSRTPLREALARLVSDGLAEPAAGRGIVVTAVSLEEAAPLFDLRIALETLAARRTAERIARSDGTPGARGGADAFAALADRFEQARGLLAAGTDPTAYYALTRELDAALDAACGNDYLAESLRGLRLHLGRLRRLARNSPDRLADSAREHADIARAIASGDPELAAASTLVHLRRAL